MTPAPMMPSRFGTSGNARAPSLSTMRSPSTSATGIRTGTDPVAMTMWPRGQAPSLVGAVQGHRDPAASLQGGQTPRSIRPCSCAAARRPRGSGSSPPCPCARASGPDRASRRRPRCRARAAGGAGCGSGARSRAGPSRGCSRRSGRCRPRPALPSGPSQASTQAVPSPSCAARIAATYPPGPAPMTTTSKLSMVCSPGWWNDSVSVILYQQIELQYRSAPCACQCGRMIKRTVHRCRDQGEEENCGEGRWPSWR